MDDHPSITDRITARRQQLERYRAAYAETYGHHIDPAKHEAQDQQLAELHRATR